MVEIISVRIEEKVVIFEAVDVSESNLQRLERTLEDEPRIVEISYDTKDVTQQHRLYTWLKQQKATQGCTTWGEALHSVLGTIVPATRYGKFY